ncbi:serine protein kinase RIO [Candidatus Thorarchaeota archaeon]|nr:MAG: serine protein kinase RIO [Candidatus Thorarchaeota archaeon]
MNTLRDAEKKRRLLEDKLGERPKRGKDSDEFKVIEGVIDPPTLKILYKLLSRGSIDAVHGAISTGKEANVYRGEDLDGNPVAVKVYRMTTAESDYMLEYIVGDPRFKRVRRSPRTLIPLWALKEYKNLQRYHEAGVSVPKPIDIERNVLIMEFIGDKDSALPAPLLKDVILESPADVFNDIIEMIEIGYNDAGLVHADLSEFNILWYGEPVFIDVSQAVLTAHDYAKKYLFRDIQNMTRFFTKMDVETEDPEVITEYILSSGE